MASTRNVQNVQNVQGKRGDGVMTVGASEFRKNIAAHLDQVLSGVPVAVIRNKRVTAFLVRATRQAVQELLDNMEDEGANSDVQPV